MASRVGVNLRASAYLHQGDRKYMEDEFQVAYQRTQDKKDIEYAFFGIFDGHGGKEAAHYAKDNLMDNIVSQRLFWSENDDDILCAIKEGFMQTHMAMWKELDQWPRTASGWPSTSGTTASIAFIRHQKIYIGHVGDSGIVLGYEDCNNEWTGVSLTKDHKPESLMEMNRINECGGKVIAKSGVPRVVWNRPKSGHQGPVRRSTPMDEIPFLAVARSLGDLWSYNASHNEFVVSPEPDVCVVEIDVSSYRCLIFGTDGLWNALSPSHAVAIAFNSEKNNEKHYLGVPLDSGKTRIWLNPSRCIVTGALERYQRVGIRADNTSSVTVFLDPPGRPKKEVLRQQMLAKKSCGASRNSVSTTKSQSTKKGSVKIHVYNNSSNESPCGGVLCLKERFPESTPASPDPKGDPIHSPQDLVFKPSECDSVHANSPAFPKTCGSVSNHSSHESISDDKKSHSCCCYTPNHSSVCSSNSPSSNDAIQIPLISSSSSSADDLSTSVDVPKKAVTHDTFSCSSRPSVIASPRRTRSFFNMAHLQASSVEKKGESDLPLTHCEPSVGHQSILLTPDVGDRVLKNVNRGSSTVSAASTKRKRLNDFLLQEEHCSKSARVNTRSISLSHKPMITRSQQRRSRNRKKAPNN